MGGEVGEQIREDLAVDGHVAEVAGAGVARVPNWKLRGVGQVMFMVRLACRFSLRRLADTHISALLASASSDNARAVLRSISLMPVS